MNGCECSNKIQFTNARAQVASHSSQTSAIEYSKHSICLKLNEWESKFNIVRSRERIHFMFNKNNGGTFVFSLHFCFLVENNKHSQKN